MTIRWQGYSHEEIYALVQQGPGREASAGAESVWGSTAETVVRIENLLTAAARDMGAGWEGIAADRTGAAITRLGQWAVDAAGAAHQSAITVTNQGGHAGDVRRLMPQPQTERRLEETTELLTDPTYIFRIGDLYELDADLNEDAQRAVDLMEGYTDLSERRADQMPPLTPPPQVVVEIGPASTVGGGPGGIAAPGSGGPGVVAVPAQFGGGSLPEVGGLAGAPGGPGALGSGVPGGPGSGGVGGLPGSGLAPPVGTAGGVVPGGGGPVGGGSGVPGAVGPGPGGGVPGPGAGPGVGGGGAGVLPGVRPPGAAEGAGGGRPVVPAPPGRPSPQPTWREVLGGAPPGRGPGSVAYGPGSVGYGAGSVGYGAGSVGYGAGGRGGLGGGGSGGGAGGPQSAWPRGGGIDGNGVGRPGVVEPVPGRGGAGFAGTGLGGPGPGGAEPHASRPTTGHPGFYPPLGMGGGAQGQGRSRPDYLVEDADVFTIDVPIGPAVISGADEGWT